jgi:serine protease
MNLSLGGGGFSQSSQNAYTQARNAGTVIVAAAGNDNTSQLSYPASYAGVISVSAVDTQKNRAPYSNFGREIDVAAPGGDNSSDRNGDGRPDGVASTGGDDTGAALEYVYLYQNGTSMAAPHMAGVVALMFEEAPGMTPAQLDQLLENGDITEDVANNGPATRDDVYGYGLIDARLAVEAAAALGGPPPPANPTLRVNPSALNFGTVQSSVDITLSNGGGGALTVAAPTDDATWLTVSALTVDANGLGTYRVAVDRGPLVDGTYSATITITSDANDVMIPVLMSKGASQVSDTGFQFILLIDPSSFDTVAQLDLSPSNGRYVYRFSGVDDGKYWVIGGTDFDNDGFICHGGEACGAYPTLDQPQALNVSGRMTGLDFGTGFVVDISAQSSALGGALPERGFRLLRPAGSGGKSLGADR